MEQDFKQLLEDLEELIEQDAKGHIANLLVDLYPSDIADLLESLDDEKKNYIFDLLDAKKASGVLLEMVDYPRCHLLESLDESFISKIVGEMDSDDATDIVGELPVQVAERVLATIDRRESREVKELLQYDEKSAGGVMAAEFVAVRQDETVQEAIEQIRKAAGEVEEIYNVYVVDGLGTLVGVLSLRKLIVSNPGRKVSEIMNRDVISVKTDVDQEEVANLVRRYDLVAIPVVNDYGRLVGRITIDDIVDIIDEEASEDISRMAGTSEEEIAEESVIRIAGIRLPWILTSLFGGLFSATVLAFFRDTLGSLLPLVFFIPVITAMGGNIGIQSSSIVVRGIATGDINIYRIGKRIFQEARVGIIMGLACGLTVGAVAYFWQGNPILGVIVALSMLCAIGVAATMGALVPIIFKKLDIDPAIATGPFVTLSNDIVGLIIYLGLATLLLRLVG